MGRYRRDGGRLTSFVLIVLFIATLIPRPLSAEAEASYWFKAELEIHHKQEVAADSIPFSIDGNRNCTPQKIVTLPRKILPIPPYYQKEVSHESCVVNTGYGAVSQSGYLQVAGETVFGRIMYPNGSTLHLLPVPRSPHGLYMTPHYPSGVKLFKINNMLEQLTGTTFDTGEKQYRLRPGFTSTALKDRFGNMLGIRREAVSFSNSGSWMITDIPYVGLARINISSFTMQVFDAGFNYLAGSEPGMQSAVSMSGRYVAIGSRSHTRFALYDLDNCSTTTRCSKLDLWQYFRSREPTYEGPGRIRFTSEFSMKFYNVSKPSGSRKIESLKLTASGHPPIEFEYLALGDSFASGEGAYQYKASTDSGNNKCHVSQRSYPYLMAEATSISEMESIACAGAIIEDLNSDNALYEGQVNDGLNVNQRTNKDEILEGFLPGFIPQDYFIEKYNPEVMTLSVLGNDIGFSKKFLRCLEPDTCYESYEDRLELVYEINNKFDDLLQLYADISELMESKRVYVIGYPSLVAENGNCALNVHLNAKELEFANKMVKHLNAVIKAAAERHGFFYVDVEYAMKGQRHCEASSFAVAFNGLTAGNDILNIPLIDFDGPVGNESYHPNHIGHKLFKEAILHKTNNLTSPMPLPDADAQPPSDLNDVELLKDAPKTNRKIYQVNYDDRLGNEVVFRGGMWKGFVEGFKGAHPALQVFIHSEPRLLGTFTSAADGSLEFNVQIPEDLPTGHHTIRVVGETIAGSPRVVEKVIYVADSIEDIDGDGVPNTQEACAYGDPSGVDNDKDGIDDACDGVIGEPANGDISDNKIPVSNGDPKPPENNPETVAGHEQTNSEHNVLQESGTDNQEVAIDRTTSPYFEPNADVPQVAASQTETVTPVNSANNSSEDELGQQTNDDWWPYVTMAAALLLIISSLYPARRKLAKKKEE